MRRHSSEVILLCIVLSACASRNAFTAADLRRNRTIVDDWKRYVAAKNWDSVSMLYADGALLMPPNQQPVHGRAAIRAWMGTLPPLQEMVAVDDTAGGDGDLGYVRGHYRATLAVAGSPSDSGSFVEVRRRQADGTWEIAEDIFNSFVPLPAPMAPPTTGRQRPN
jgi:ketosteroid isomerase-like protein